MNINNNPITTDIDIGTYTWVFLKAVRAKGDVIEWTWLVLSTLKSSYQNWKTWNQLDTNCKLDDIVIWTQIWAWCDSTLGNWYEWECLWLWWYRNWLSPSNNIAEKLRIPLAWQLVTSTASSSNRGRSTDLWSSTQEGNSAFTRNFSSQRSEVRRNFYDKALLALSVRCIKD